MQFDRIDRRTLLKGLGGAAALTAFGAGARQAQAETLDEVIRGAEKEGALFWYDSLGGGQEALEEFQKEYPFIKKVEYVRVPGAQKVSRFVQESLAGGPSGDILNQAAPANQTLIDQGLAIPVDWAGLGVSDKLIGNEYLISTVSVVTVIIYNTNLVKGDDIPRTWQDMVDPKWANRTGKYARAAEMDAISVAWGPEKTLEYVREYAKLKPRLAESTAALNQAVGSGELHVGFTAYDSAVRLKESGAPIDFHSPDIAVVASLYSLVSKAGANPNAAKLFLAWMSTPKGAKAFEDHVLRGNAFVEGTHANQIVSAADNIVYRSPEDLIKNAEEINAFDRNIENILQGRA